MSVAETLTLPGQPGAGRVDFQGFAGDGYTAPIAEYLVDFRLAHDASGGTANLILDCDPRYTNVITWVSLVMSGLATAAEYHLSIRRGAGNDPGGPAVVGTMPLVAATLTSSNNAFLWFPPPLLFQGDGQISWLSPNVDGDTSFMRAQVYVFDINVRQTAALPYLLQNFKGAGGSTPV